MKEIPTCRICWRAAFPNGFCFIHYGRGRKSRPIISQAPEPVVTTKAWQCGYCSTANADEQLECGAGEWGGCGASRFDADPEFDKTKKHRLAMDSFRSLLSGDAEEDCYFPQATFRMVPGAIVAEGVTVEKFKRVIKRVVESALR